ncbi:antitoxin VapB [Rhizomicrobium palustre]|uniref:Antitoxin VapB n=1 Tax=Rhizomicrobium palustre TaxID=189966 RepID=A0A846MXE6_9PROT|nr:type II toxin-antitoxin system VapB family antitoxin [Rhizomicrobium palustre]NIK88238.1 antitoxin VapB [Rhizomicrobium palustre]
MNVRISDPKIDQLAAELAKRTGEDPTALVIRTLEERLQAEPVPLRDEAAVRADREKRKAEILQILARIDSMPVVDNRPPDELLYDAQGLPG